jgi:hypothetical protein
MKVAYQVPNGLPATSCFGAVRRAWELNRAKSARNQDETKAALRDAILSAIDNVVLDLVPKLTEPLDERPERWKTLVWVLKAGHILDEKHVRLQHLYELEETQKKSSFLG